MVGDRTHGDDARDRAGETGKQRNERPAGQADGPHQAVEQIGRARQVAAFFERQDEPEKDQDLRQEHDDGTCPGDDAVNNQATQPPVRQQLLRACSECRGTILDQFHRHFGPAEHGLEHQEQQHHQHRGTDRRMKQYAVNALAGEVGDELLEPESRQDGLHPLVVRLDVRCLNGGLHLRVRGACPLLRIV